MSQTATLPENGKADLAQFGGRKAIETKPATGLRLNLGAGTTHLDGFTNLDRKTGQEVYPLPYEDGSVAAQGWASQRSASSG